MDTEDDTAPQAEKSVQDVILELLDADPNQKTDVKDAVLDALAHVADVTDGRDETHCTPTYLAKISVAGFRGIGPGASLDLYPAPGLMVVSGRNGSGKSSFVEALELALTGTSYRWLKKETLWTQAWQNLHQPSPCEIQIGFTREGTAPITVGMRWSPGDGLTERTTWTQSAGGKQTESTESLGWARPLQLYRPVLSYDELGRLLDGGPSALYDALAKVLGLEVLTDAEKWLATRLKDIKAARDNADQERKRLQAVLAESSDERATKAAALLRTKGTPLQEALALATGAGDADLQTIPQLRALTRLETPTLDEIQIAAERLTRAAQARAETTTTVIDTTQRRLQLLEGALHFYERAGDTDCPVCGQGLLDSEWAAQARDTITDAEAALAEYHVATKELSAARSGALDLTRRLAPVVQPGDADLSSLSEYQTAVTAAQRVPDDDTALAAHLESAVVEAIGAAEILRNEAVELLAQQEGAWAPLAAQLSRWIQLETEATRHDDAVKTMAAAKKWMSDHAGTFRNLRLKPISDRARWIWSQLRQESNVELGEITLEGTAHKRRANLPGWVDGQPTKALSVMSQGELHALALALFIPRATAAASPFRFVVLDDPIQAMDPAKIDGFVQVLSAIARTHQVIVFSHDDRLASVIRETGVDARMVEVTREAGSRVSLHNAVSPALRGIGDVFALLSDKGMPDDVKRRAAPGLFRIALEAAAKQAYYRRQGLAGRPRAESEERWADAKKTLTRVALAVHGDPSADLTGWRKSKPARDHALWISNAGAHGAAQSVTIKDARDLERTVLEVLALT